MAAGDINSLVVVTDRWPPDRLSGDPDLRPGHRPGPPPPARITLLSAMGVRPAGHSKRSIFDTLSCWMASVLPRVPQCVSGPAMCQLVREGDLEWLPITGSSGSNAGAEY